MLKIHSYTTREALNRAVLERLEEQAQRAIRVRGQLSLAVGGGSSPVGLYREWAQRETFPWSKTFLTLSDERYLPVGDPDCNDSLLRRELLSRIPVQLGQPNYLPYPLERAYAEIPEALAMALPERLDIALLGLGPDGHTASLFPHFPLSLHGEGRLSLSLALAQPCLRISLSLAYLKQARERYVYVCGAEKREIVSYMALRPERAILPMPLLSLAEQGELHIFCDFEVEEAIAPESLAWRQERIAEIETKLMAASKAQWAKLAMALAEMSAAEQKA